jgi:hypothetical protein
MVIPLCLALQISKHNFTYLVNEVLRTVDISIFSTDLKPNLAPQMSTHISLFKKMVCQRKATLSWLHEDQWWTHEHWRWRSKLSPKDCRRGLKADVSYMIPKAHRNPSEGPQLSQNCLKEVVMFNGLSGWNFTVHYPWGCYNQQWEVHEVACCLLEAICMSVTRD